MLFDTHTHLNNDSFTDEERVALAAEVEASDVGLVMDVGFDEPSSLLAAEHANRYPWCYAVIGMHPHDSKLMDEAMLERFRQIAKSEPKVKAIGEIGLDYHYERDSREKQLEVFEKQLVLANELSLPVIVHDREAHEDTLNLLKKHRPHGVVHCFSGSVETAKEIIKLGMYIGLGGAVTFKNAVKPAEVAAFVPKDRLLLETDAPYMSPVPYRGKRCTSLLIPYTAEKIAAVRGEAVEELLFETDKNARTLFHIGSLV